MLYLEDVHVGMVFTSGPSEPLDEAAIKAFAAAFDPQPFHLDEAAAARHPIFQGLAASGWHTAAISMRLMVESVPTAGGIIGAGGELSWPAPARPGDVFTVVSEVLEVTPSRSRPERGSCMLRSETRNQHGVVVQRFTAKTILHRRPV